jgi:hypothetical protein
VTWHFRHRTANFRKKEVKPLKKLFLIWCIFLMAAIAAVACKKKEETAPPASSEQQNTETQQGQGMEHGTNETAPSDQGGSQ